MGSLCLGLCQASHRIKYVFFLLAMPVEYATLHAGISALPVEGKLLSVFSLLHKLTNYWF